MRPVPVFVSCSLTSAVRVSLALLLVGVAVSAARAQEPPSDASPQVPDSVVQRVVTAFTDGDAQLLLTPAADRVEVSLLGGRTYYSSAQAFYVLRDFFEERPPAEFVLTDATATGRSGFLQGRLTHARDERALQVYVRLVQRQDDWRLQEVRVDSGAE